MSFITDQTIQRFSLLTPFQTSATYQSRVFVGGLATDTYTSYALPQVRTREVTQDDVPQDFDLTNKKTKILELWSDITGAAGMPPPRKDDRWVDQSGVVWTVFQVDQIFHENCFVLFSVQEV